MRELELLAKEVVHSGEARAQGHLLPHPPPPPPAALPLRSGHPHALSPPSPRRRGRDRRRPAGPGLRRRQSPAPSGSTRIARKSFREDELAAIRAAEAAYLEAARAPRVFFEIWERAYAASRAGPRPQRAHRRVRLVLLRARAGRGAAGRSRPRRHAPGEHARPPARGGAPRPRARRYSRRGRRRSRPTGCAPHGGAPRSDHRRRRAGDGWPLRDGLPQTLEEICVHVTTRPLQAESGGLARRGSRPPGRDRGHPGPAGAGPLRRDAGRRAVQVHGRLRAPRRRHARGTPALARLVASIAFIEQPLDRAIALDPAATDGLAALGRRLPMLIDKSDDALDAFRARSPRISRGLDKELQGHREVLPEPLARRARQPPPRARPAPLHERGGPDERRRWCPCSRTSPPYGSWGSRTSSATASLRLRGLGHCSATERRDERHADLYEGDAREPMPGAYDVRSLAAPGYGVAFAPDLASMIPWKRPRAWRTAPDRLSRRPLVRVERGPSAQAAPPARASCGPRRP